jgi:hypothetical protein
MESLKGKVDKLLMEEKDCFEFEYIGEYEDDLN